MHFNLMCNHHHPSRPQLGYAGITQVENGAGYFTARIINTAKGDQLADRFVRGGVVAIAQLPSASRLTLTDAVRKSVAKVASVSPADDKPAQVKTELKQPATAGVQLDGDDDDIVNTPAAPATIFNSVRANAKGRVHATAVTGGPVTSTAFAAAATRPVPHTIRGISAAAKAVKEATAAAAATAVAVAASEPSSGSRRKALDEQSRDNGTTTMAAANAPIQRPATETGAALNGSFEYDVASACDDSECIVQSDAAAVVAQLPITLAASDGAALPPTPSTGAHASKDRRASVASTPHAASAQPVSAFDIDIDATSPVRRRPAAIGVAAKRRRTAASGPAHLSDLTAAGHGPGIAGRGRRVAVDVEERELGDSGAFAADSDGNAAQSQPGPRRAPGLRGAHVAIDVDADDDDAVGVCGGSDSEIVVSAPYEKASSSKPPLLPRPYHAALRAQLRADVEQLFNRQLERQREKCGADGHPEDASRLRAENIELYLAEKQMAAICKTLPMSGREVRCCDVEDDLAVEAALRHAGCVWMPIFPTATRQL